MRSLFFKIFVIFWIAQSLIFVISTALILRQRFPDPGLLFDSLFSSLRNESRESVAAFETGGCDALHAYAVAHEHAIALSDDTGRDMCAVTEGQQGNGAGMSFPGHITGKQVGQQYVWSVPVTSMEGKKYVFLLSLPHTPEQHTWYQDLLHFAFPQLPVAIAVGGATTLVLVLLFTRPLVRLRKAAGDLARGNLKTRVRESGSRTRVFEGDEFQALVHDFNHMAERLESLVGAQQLLLRDVSHELRSPLARLNVALELAREDADPGMAAHLSRIERETEKLNQLIGQLLTLSSMEALEKVNTFSPVSLAHLIEEMIPDAEYEAHQRQISVAFRAEDECIISGNQELLYQAIENVVRNAIRFTESGSKVEIRLAIVPQQEACAAVIEVNDHGPGIPEDEINAIFRPFYRVDSARSPETGGFGVGLAIAERAVKLHHGKMCAVNRNGGGATIRMCFPLSEDKGNRVRTLEAANPAS